MSDSPFPDLERSLYIGNAFGLILYGVLICLTFHSIFLLNASTDVSQRRVRRAYTWYSIIVLVLIAIALMANVLMGQLMWIEHRNFPSSGPSSSGGPVGYWNANGNIWFNIFGSAADILADFMSNALLLYRCYIVWNRNWLIITFPLLVYLANIAMALLALVQSAAPLSNFYQGVTVNFAIPWLALTSFFNFMVTCLIAGRIMFLSRRIDKILPAETKVVYAGVVAILVEAAVPTTVLGIIFAVLEGRNLIESVALSILWGTFIAISPQLIILRVAMGRGWTDATVSQFSGNMTFASNQYASTNQMSTVGGSHVGNKVYGESDQNNSRTLPGFNSENSLEKM
ncbi:hypothetical protein M422DRAFT_43020 [Sphaerobolus stellatus SS14]|nr:hypothetical protein M422DRAFT_43020 [Sphaerobolus stellatus SS14]